MRSVPPCPRVAGGCVAWVNGLIELRTHPVPRSVTDQMQKPSINSGIVLTRLECASKLDLIPLCRWPSSPGLFEVVVASHDRRFLTREDCCLSRLAVCFRGMSEQIPTSSKVSHYRFDLYETLPPM